MAGRRQREQCNSCSLRKLVRLEKDTVKIYAGYEPIARVPFVFNQRLFVCLKLGCIAQKEADLNLSVPYINPSLFF